MLDLKGVKFNRLTGIEPVGRTNDNKIIWKFKCDCGKDHLAVGKDVKSGNIKSCGCLMIEKTTAMGKANKTHGHASDGKVSKTYMCWDAMKKRCLNPNDRYYKDYGGRGITICNRWLEPDGQGFINFLKDMGEKPRGKSLNRIKNDLLKNSYSPNNCCWSTQKEQCRNKRNNHLIPYKGKDRTIAECSEMTEIHKATIRQRLANGWSVEDALTIPPDTRHNWRK